MVQSSCVISLDSFRQSCSGCSLRELCLPHGIDIEDLHKIESIVERGTVLPRGHTLYRQGDKLEYVYAIRSGSIKTYTLNHSGDIQITGFHLPSELIGLEGLASGAHECTAQTLEATEVCRLPFTQLDSLAQELPSLHRQLMRIMAREINATDRLLLLLAQCSADVRMAALLLSLHKRLQRGATSGHSLRLSMSRRDMGNYLGLAIETVSRLLTRLNDSGVIRVRRNEIDILDFAQLKTMAGSA